MRNIYLLTLIFILGGFKSSFSQYYNPNQSQWQERKVSDTLQLSHQVFLIGDAGKPQTDGNDPVLNLLKSKIRAAGKNSTTIFLGDNIYPLGMPAPDHPSRKQSEERLSAQLEILKEYEGMGIVVPGNHDWSQSGKNGYANILYQQEFIEKVLGLSVFSPTDGCPGPVEIPLGEDIVLIIYDSQWWIHQHDKPEGEESTCEIKSEEEFLIAMDDAINRNYDKKIIVAAHHPLYSNGLHGGHAPGKYHLFPLTDIKKNLYIPLPILGTGYVFYRTVLGNIQDIPHPNYKLLRKSLESIFEQHPDLIYVAGHDHSLQLIKKPSANYIISGAGSKETFVKHKDKADFAYAKKGFSVINFYNNGETWVDFITTEEPAGKLVFRKQLIGPTPPKPPSIFDGEIDISEINVDAKATEHLNAGSFKKLWLGENYRKEWHEPLQNVPLFDIGTERGGLVIKKRGGGQQTKSLRLEAKNEKQYVLRSIEKFPEKAVPLSLRGTIAADVVEDQISGSHPYGAFVIPKLADAMGVYHTNPKIVYLPDDPRLTIYRKDFGGALYLYEERPDDDWSDAGFFGNSKKIVSTPDVLEKTREDNDDLVDQMHVLKSRLFDMWIGDWDRHDDQWRWARFKDEKNDTKIYRPIPRDRDQAFFNAEGILISVANRKWGLRKFQGFKHEIRDPEGYGFNARYFDRSFLTEPTLDDWLETSNKLQSVMTNELIEEAIKEFPPEIYRYSGEEIISKLKSRRDHMDEYAETLYRSISREVNVTGSDKHELFEVNRINDTDTEVKVWKVKKDDHEKKNLIYDRVFKRGETKEIRLYGFGGEDIFNIKGNVNKGIKIRVIGGEDHDMVSDSSQVKGSKKTLVYDTFEGSTLYKTKEVKDLRSKKPSVNSYNRKEFQYNLLAPIATAKYNPADGIFFGPGALIIRHGFRKEPYKSKHTILTDFSPKTQSFEFTYKGEFIDALKGMDYLIDFSLRDPSWVDYFYGSGNETENIRSEEGTEYYRVRYDHLRIVQGLRKRYKGKVHEFGGFLGIQHIHVQEEQNEKRFLVDYLSGPDSVDLFGNDNTFAGLNLTYQLDLRDNEISPTKGILFDISAWGVSGLSDTDFEEISYTRYNGNFSFYISTPQKRFKTTFASRMGGGININNYQEVYQSQTLGGLRNLRGYRRQRFAGEKSLYFNNEIRSQLLNLKTYILPFQFGILGFYDIGRVWVKNDPSTATGKSSKWHKGYGLGVWIEPMDAVVLSVDFSNSEEEHWYPFLRLGFLF
ncbi:BamA/TamA family outer membrane protein [Flammeovirgaceae bacterium SG7u.111]|nr:BamA/TamA family outer membrane protein [Flammeovirgaceae bacterium SG7u.132]WPO33117.1 BamA/TamA family outer membrane protein [Flammeovirgaceae bacterium SG7u.111]